MRKINFLILPFLPSTFPSLHTHSIPLFLCPPSGPSLPLSYFPIPFNLFFVTLSLHSLRSTCTNTMDFKFGWYIHMVHPNKSPLKRKGAWAYPGTAHAKNNPLLKIRHLWNCCRFFRQIYSIYRRGFKPHMLRISLQKPCDSIDTTV